MYTPTMNRIVIASLLSITSLFAAEVSPFLPAEEAGQIVVNNRILAQVNGRTISVLDLMKKMDVYLSQHYPQALESTSARFQFYTNNWNAVLDQMIDNELILADSTEKEIKPTDAEIREQMMQKFGPNIMSSLDKLQMSYEEAREMTSTEIAVQKMTSYRVINKALQRVSPQDVKMAYQLYCEKNPPVEEWKYQVLSIRGEVPEEGKQVAERAFQLLQNKDTTFASVASILQQESPTLSITVSNDYQATNKDLAASHKEVLALLENSSYSAPVAQVSRVDGATVYRIFLLKEYTLTPTPSFAQVSDKLQDYLLQQSVAEGTGNYVQKLRGHFGFESANTAQALPPDFEPFVLR